MTDGADATIRAVAALDEEQRLRLYEFIRAARRPVSRDEAAAAVGISRKLAAFHLDKLVEVGLLRSRLRAVGAARVGRRPKMYEPADTDIQVSIPARRHEILADILTQAVLTEEQHGSAKAAAARAAHERGFTAGATVRDRIRPGRLGAERALTLAEGILAKCGFDPDRDGPGCLRLRNCPFHPIAASAPELICELNLAFMTGLIAGLHARTVEAVLAPAAGERCVEVRRRS
jgi:predicted ArsR family transcriptional regulator